MLDIVSNNAEREHRRCKYCNLAFQCIHLDTVLVIQRYQHPHTHFYIREAITLCVIPHALPALIMEFEESSTCGLRSAKDYTSKLDNFQLFRCEGMEWQNDNRTSYCFLDITWYVCKCPEFPTVIKYCDAEWCNRSTQARRLHMSKSVTRNIYITTRRR